MAAEQEFRYPSVSTRKENVSPLILSSNGHPGYQPFKLNIKTASDLKINKVKLPEKPFSPFMRFNKKIFDQVKSANPDLKQWEISSTIQKMWKELSDSEKQEFINEYENSKFEYCEQLKAFHNSPQYQNFLSSSSKKSKNANGSSNISNFVSNNPTIVSLNYKTNDVTNTGTIYSTALSHYAIEPADDDGIDETLSQKYLASIRFQRNHRLLNDIFNEICVQDGRSVVTQQRMEQLKKQVASLESHQEKLKQELLQIQDRYETKKRKLMSSSKDFDREMFSLKNSKISDEQENQFFTKYYEIIQKQWKDYIDNFTSTIANRNITKESAQNLLREGLENMLNSANSTKSLMTISNIPPINVVALQQTVEPSTSSNSLSNTIQSELNPNVQPQINQIDQSRPSQTNLTSNQLIGAQLKYGVSNISSSITRSNIQQSLSHNQIHYLNQNQYNSQQNQLRSTNTPPIGSITPSIISPTNQISNQPSTQTIQSQISNQASHNVQTSSNRISQQIRSQSSVPSISNQTMVQPHGISQINPNQNLNQNINYYHQSQMPINQIHMYNSVNMVQPTPHLCQQVNQQASSQGPQQQTSQYNTNINIIQQSMNYSGQIQPSQQIPPPQYSNNIHQQLPSQIQGQMLYGQHAQHNVQVFNQQGQSQQQLIMMQQQQFGNMFQQIQSSQSQIQSQSNQMKTNQFVNQQNTPQSQVNSPQTKLEKKTKEEKQKKKSNKKVSSNE